MMLSNAKSNTNMKKIRNGSKCACGQQKNDAWTAEFIVDKQGTYTYFVEGWVDYALNWQHGTERKIQDNQHVKSELLEGAEYVKAVQKLADATEKEYLKKVTSYFTSEKQYDQAIEAAMSHELTAIFQKISHLIHREQIARTSGLCRS